MDALDGSAAQIKAPIELKFLEIDTNVKSKLNQIFSAVYQRCCGKEPVLELEVERVEEEEHHVST